MKIGFLASKDGEAPQEMLEDVLKRYPGASWVHGGGVGYNDQVARFAGKHGIATEIIGKAETKIPQETKDAIQLSWIMQTADVVVCKGKPSDETVMAAEHATVQVLSYPFDDDEIDSDDEEDTPEDVG